MAYCFQSDLENAVGGAAVLVQLLDKDGDQVADVDLVNSIINRASAEVASAIQVSTDLTALNSLSVVPDSLVYTTADIAAYFAYLDGTDGQAVPENVKIRYQDALRWLDQVARRERTIGALIRPATSQDVQQIDPDPLGVRVTRDSMKGFW